MDDRNVEIKKSSLMKEYDDYFSILGRFSGLLTQAKDDARKGNLSFEEIEKLKILNPEIPTPEILSLKSLVYLSLGDEGSAIAILTVAVKLHPMPLAEVWDLCRLHYKKGDFMETAFYANILEEMDRIRSDDSFVDAARTAKSIALCKIGFNNISKFTYVNIKRPYFRMEGRPISVKDIEDMIYR